MSYHPTKFGGHRHIGSRDIMIFACHMILQDNVIRALCGFMVMSPSRKVTILTSFMAIGTAIVEI